MREHRYSTNLQAHHTEQRLRQVFTAKPLFEILACNVNNRPVRQFSQNTTLLQISQN